MQTTGAKAFRLGLARQLLKHRDFFDNEFRPMANGLSKPAFDACHIVGSARVRKLLQKTPVVPAMDDLVRVAASESDELCAVEALKCITHVKSRIAMTEHASLVDVPYTLNVGDVVQHSLFGHIGVVAARLPVCFESDDWVLKNLGSLDDRRMQHPWYLVLVQQHVGLPPHFVRFGSQLTHTRVEPQGGIGYHQMLPTFFKGFDRETGRYIPRFDSDTDADLTPLQVAGCIPPGAKHPSKVRSMVKPDGPGCKLPPKTRRTVEASLK